jgi:hypothetical protein
MYAGSRNVLHALGATGPVAVMEIETFALENEGADAVLSHRQRAFEHL